MQQGKRGGIRCLATIALACGTIAAGACMPDGQCAAACVDRGTLRFEPPISEPGSYQVVAGPIRCGVELPAQSSDCGLDIHGFAITGAAWLGKSERSIAVEVDKDGQRVLSTRVEAESFKTHEVCGSTCMNASYVVAVPSELEREPWGPCAEQVIDGDYQLIEQSGIGNCPNLDPDGMIRLSNGVPVFDDANCAAELVSFSAEQCRLSSRASCQAASLDVSWSFELIDVVGDGSRLLGTASVDMQAPIACEGRFNVELRR